MTTKYVTGPSPITFISESIASPQSVGTQYQIPLGALTVDSTTGAPSAAAWITQMTANGITINAIDQAVLSSLLTSLSQQGLLSIITVS